MLDAELRQETDELVRAHGEILRRLGQEGVSGVEDLKERFDQIRRATQSLSVDEIRAAIGRVDDLRERLRRTRAELDALGQMRLALGLGQSAGDAGEPEERLD